MAARPVSLNSMDCTFADSQVPRISKREFAIAGIITTVYGLAELPATVAEVAVLWLLHPRLERSETMLPMAAIAVTSWNDRTEIAKVRSQKGLIAISIDIRNHGRRHISAKANEVWRTANPNHAKDMFSACHGTAYDVSLLIDHLPSYLFPDEKVAIIQHICCGVSLGGHTTWQLLVSEPRITTCIAILGCADFVRLLTDRARLSKLPDYVSTDPPGKDFLGSPSLPNTLLNVMKRFDAAQQIMGASYEAPERELSDYERVRLRKFYNERLQGKRLLIISGGADKMVPYSRSQPMIEFLAKAVNPKTGWWGDGGMTIKNVVAAGVKHELTMGMVDEAVNFVLESVGSGIATSAGPGVKL